MIEENFIILKFSSNLAMSVAQPTPPPALEQPETKFHILKKIRTNFVFGADLSYKNLCAQI